MLANGLEGNNSNYYTLASRKKDLTLATCRFTSPASVWQTSAILVSNEHVLSQAEMPGGRIDGSQRGVDDESRPVFGEKVLLFALGNCWRSEKGQGEKSSNKAKKTQIQLI